MDATAASEAEKPGATGAPVGLLSGLKGFVVWLAGAVGGITAMMYGAGYLVTRAHLSMLGLYGFVEVDNDYFLQEGAKFFVVVGFKLARLGVPLLSIGTLLALLAFLVGWLLSRAAFVRRALDKTRALGQRQIGGVALPRAVHFAVFVALLVTALGYAGNAVIGVQGALCISNLLYAEQPHITCSDTKSKDAEDLQNAIMHPGANNGGPVPLANRQFENSLYDIVGACLLIYAAWYYAPRSRYRAFLMSPLLMALVLFAIQLPMSYGILERSLTYPVVELRMDEAHPLPAGDGPYFLLNKTDAGFVVWDRSLRRVLWLPSGSVERAQISAVENLFTDDHAPAAPARGNSP